MLPQIVMPLLFLSLVLTVIYLSVAVIYLTKNLKSVTAQKNTLEMQLISTEKRMTEGQARLNKCRTSCEWHKAELVETYVFMHRLSYEFRTISPLISDKARRYSGCLLSIIKSGTRIFPSSGQRESVSFLMWRYRKRNRASASENLPEGI